METLSSGSIGPKKTDFNGALVYIIGQETIGMIVRHIDDDQPYTDSRYWVYYGNGKMFGTYLCDLLPLQLLPSQMHLWKYIEK